MCSSSHKQSAYRILQVQIDVEEVARGEPITIYMWGGKVGTSQWVSEERDRKEEEEATSAEEDQQIWPEDPQGVLYWHQVCQREDHLQILNDHLDWN